jgi:uncharacterized membrane protein YphA (DoxX/SURF4 family)
MPYVPEPPAAWKHWLGWMCAVLLAALFLVSGFWKLVDPLATEQRMVQMLFPRQVALLVAIGVGVTEAWAGLMILVPRWRKWGAWLCGLLLVAFMVYMGVNYARLTGEDCSCFPWLKRVVGPAFFISDAVMLVGALLAGLWARGTEGWKHAAAGLGAIVVFAGAVYGVTATQQSGVLAPASVIIDGKPYSLHEGRVLIYFFDPECMHCFAGAQRMSRYAWKGEVKVLAVATVNPKWAEGFLKDTGLRAMAVRDPKALREVFAFTDPPYGVAIERGRQVAAFPFFDEKEPFAALQKLGWVQ